MANEIYWSTAGGGSTVEGEYGYDYRLLRENLIEALYPANNVLDLVRRTSIAGFPTDQERFPIVPTLSASSVDEATDLSASAFAPTQQPVTAAEVGVMVTIGDLAQSATFTGLDHYGAELGKAIAKKIATDITGLLGGFSTSVDPGTDTDPLTEAVFLQALTTLQTADVPEPYAAILHPRQASSLFQSLGSSVGALVGAGGRTPRAETNDLVAQSGDAGTLFNVRVVTNSTVAGDGGTPNARDGGMFSMTRAIGFVEKWMTRLELDRDGSARHTEIIATTAYGVAELDDTSGVEIKSDDGDA